MDLLTYAGGLSTFKTSYLRSLVWAERKRVDALPSKQRRVHLLKSLSVAGDRLTTEAGIHLNSRSHRGGERRLLDETALCR